MVNYRGPCPFSSNYRNHISEASPWELSKQEQDSTHGNWWDGFYGEAERVKREKEARQFIDAAEVVQENEPDERAF